MLYVFHVDTGRMLTFDMNIAVESVQYLKETIERHHAIPAAEQVLLVSGGETLQSNARVATYSAGTDTNPIFMFCKAITENRILPPPWPSIDNDGDLKQQVDKCLELPATYTTVVKRAQLAQHIHEMAREELKICERVVMEQHLQQQGWCAVVANLEDITAEFQERCGVFFRSFNEHNERRTDYLEFLSNFNDDLIRLAKIPILSGLIKNAEDRFHGFDDVYADEEFNKSDTSTNEQKCSTSGSTGSTEPNAIEMQVEPKKEIADDRSETPSISDKLQQRGRRDSVRALSLLQWISAKENQRSLQRMAENCAKEMEMFDEKNTEKLQQEIKTAVDAAQRDDMKEIKGLEDRLQRQERLMFDAKKIVQGQSELANAFQLNQSRAANLGDTSILPDLCASHKEQLMVMLQNHTKLRDICRRCSKAKNELGDNLCRRLKFIIQIENIMYDIDSRLLFYHNCLKRLQKHLNIIEQIHQAPSIYVTAVTEVVRRKEFSTVFLSWASNLACQLLTIYNDETVRRQEFASIFEGHFLTTLFPGMQDMPPPFATEAPIFDTNLPNLTRNDMTELANQLPDYAAKSSFFREMDNIIEFFTQSQNQHKMFVNNEKQQEIQLESQMLKPLEIHSHLKECFESETDTEEFEKVSQSTVDRRYTVNVQGTCTGGNIPVTIIKPGSVSMATSTYEPQMISVETLTDENIDTHEHQMAHLKNILHIMHKLTCDSILKLRNDLSHARLDLSTVRSEIFIDMDSLKKTWNALELETKNRERELVQRLTVDHELELNDIRKCLSMKDDEIQVLQNDRTAVEATRIDEITQHENEKCVLRDSVEKLMDEVSQLKEELENAAALKERALQETRENMVKEHKIEMEGFKSRLKLMTSVERSPSDTSLEKIERPDMIDIVNHETIVAQMREDLMKDKEKAVKEAIDAERAKYLADSHSAKSLCLGESPRSLERSQEMYKRILEEKERQIEHLRERESILARENLRMKETIQSLADSDITESQMSIIKDRLDQLIQEKEKLEYELRKEKQKRAKLQANISGRSSAAIESCTIGDLVTVVWSPKHELYMVVQDSPTLFFLQTDCYAELGLVPPKEPDILPNILHTLGVVIKKDYCRARKDENRYRVPKGTQFYVLKLKPKSNATRRDSTSCSAQRLSNAQLIDSFAQTDMEPLFEQGNDMVDSGVSEQQKSIYKDRTGSTEETTDEIESGSGGARPDNLLDDTEEADGNIVLMIDSTEIESTPVTTTRCSNTKCLDDDDLMDSLSDEEFRSLENPVKHEEEL